jgi:succinate-semialdehyde dehydrogenase/glutarate-semialdehyde dehydrogenase
LQTHATLLEVTNPADGGAVGELLCTDAAGARAAADAAAAAFEQWSRSPARTRADVLLRTSAALIDQADELGLLLARETGKRLPEAVGEIRFAAEYFRWFAEEARRPAGQLIPAEAGRRRHHTLARAVGVAVCLTPWNFPVSIQARKIAPALAAGCTVLARPSEKAPLAVARMFELMHEAGVPEGAANLVIGPAAELTEALIAHAAVRVVSFTGSTTVGRSILKLAAERVVRPLMELGGDAPFIVFADGDLDRAVEGAMLAKFRNNGQSCIAANRFYVEAPVYEEFTRRFTARVDAMTIGDPVVAPIPDLGPLIDAGRKRAVAELVAEARGLGARLLTAEREELDGSFMAPALLSGVPAGARLSCEEVFGPAAAIFRFEHEEEAVTAANATEMGLAGYLYTGSIDRALRLQEQIEVGILGLNNALPSVAFAPMGGWKQSGLGREGARQGLEEYQELTYVSTELA